MKLSIDSLAIEITRRCNMHCAHCMRGKAEQRDLDLNKARQFLKQVESIRSITFTGGEPTLNVPALKAVLQICKDLHIYVGSFYLVTNGKQVTTEFLTTMVEWYSYILECKGDIDMCGIACSRDDFHSVIPAENLWKLQALSFFWPEDKKNNFKTSGVLELGNAATLEGYLKRAYRPMLPEISEFGGSICVNEGTLALTVDGDILMDCDYSYENTQLLKLADASNAMEVFTKAATDPNFSFGTQIAC